MSDNAGHKDDAVKRKPLEPESVAASSSSSLQRGAERLEKAQICDDTDRSPAEIIAADPGIKVMFDREALVGAVSRGWLETNRRWDSELAFSIVDSVMELLARKWEHGDG